MSENISTLSSTSIQEKRSPATAAARCPGSARQPSASTSKPSGTLKANSHGHEATERIAAATDGPATEALATTTELSAMPRPSCARG